ncbi:MAG: DUF305 domain-containing protein [Anaerolineae bacterium]
MTALDQLSPSPANSASNRGKSLNITLLLLLVTLLLALAAVFWLANNLTRLPTQNSTEAGFAQDMIVHHAQAVELALLLYDRTENDTLRTMALDMMLTQQAQIGQMQGWLRIWQLPYASVVLPMTWMDMPTEQMPGMATAEQINALRETSGIDADRQFINLMIPHHTAAIHMAEAIVNQTQVPAVRELARSIIDSQQREIDALRQILAELDSTTP